MSDNWTWQPVEEPIGPVELEIEYYTHGDSDTATHYDAGHLGGDWVSLGGDIVTTINWGAHEDYRLCRRVPAPQVSVPVDGNTSDGYHTFNELYEHRHTLFAALLKCYPEMAWKSWRHGDGSVWEGWFICGLDTPHGQVSYHLPAKWWDRVQAREIVQNNNYDGHTSADVLERVAKLPAPQASVPVEIADILRPLVNEVHWARYGSEDDEQRAALVRYWLDSQRPSRGRSVW